jgi:hypothetical protein
MKHRLSFWSQCTYHTPTLTPLPTEEHLRIFFMVLQHPAEVPGYQNLHGATVPTHLLRRQVTKFLPSWQHSQSTPSPFHTRSREYPDAQRPPTTWREDAPETVDGRKSHQGRPIQGSPAPRGG